MVRFLLAEREFDFLLDIELLLRRLTLVTFLLRRARSLKSFERWLSLLVGEIDREPRLQLECPCVSLLPCLMSSRERDRSMLRLRRRSRLSFFSMSCSKFPATDICCCFFK
jgi:hypothetical protein